MKPVTMPTGLNMDERVISFFLLFENIFNRPQFSNFNYRTCLPLLFAFLRQLFIKEIWQKAHFFYPSGFQMFGITSLCTLGFYRWKTDTIEYTRIK